MYKVVLVSALTYVALGLSISTRLGQLGAAKNHTRGFHNSHVHHQMVDEIRNRTNKWKPMEPEENPFAGKTDDELRGYVGALEHTDYEGTGSIENQPSGFDWDLFNQLMHPDQKNNTDDNNNNNNNNNNNDNNNNNNVVVNTGSFDARTKWGSCIHPVMNQGSCGSCWAFSTTEVLSDRLCIASSGSINVVLSPEYILGCSMSNGCNGGYPDRALTYLGTNGAPVNDCVPYSSKQNTCPSACTTSNQSFKRYYCKNGSTMTLTSATSQKTEIQTNGPMVTIFTVYGDFYNYKSGIYHHVSGLYMGSHAVKVIGWGSSSGTDYWIIQNSWGTSWGESGYFRIQVGDSGVGAQMYSCTANTSA